MQVSLHDVTKSFGSEVIFSGVTAKIEDNDRIGLVGPNGTGKTTLLRVICGELEPDDGPGEIARGSDLSIGYQKQNCGLTFEGTIWQEMQSVFADVYALERRMKELQGQMAAGDSPTLAEEYRRTEDAFLARDGYQIEVKIKTVLTGMGFAENGFDKCVDKLSGGEQTRLAIAKLLLEAPSLLILDEPTNHLDFATLNWLEDYLSGYKGALLVVSHDRYFLDKLCNKIWELEDAALWEYKGNYTAYTKQREEQDARQKKLYEQQQAERAKLEDYVARNLVRASTTKMAQSRQKMLERLEPVGKPRRRLKPPKIRLEFETEPVKDVLTVENLTITVGSGEKERVLLSGAEFNIQRGDKVAIIGPNGSGKTTLLRALLSAQPPVTGRISWGRGVKRSYYDQGSDHLDQSLTVMDTMWKAYPRMYETPLRTALGAMGLTGEDAYRLVGQLSGGERARLKLAMICLAGSNVLVLDEPTNHLDLPSKEVLQQALSEYEGTLIIVSHDRYLLDRVPNRIFAIENGKLTQYKGGYGDYLKARAEQGSEKAAPTHTRTDSEQKKQYNRGKEQRREDARRRKEYAEAEALIHTLEEELEAAKAEMSLDSVQNDYQRLQELCTLIEEKQQLLDATLDRWLIISEELGNL
mgnify:FL=1